jgi:hypothetical protein
MPATGGREEEGIDADSAADVGFGLGVGFGGSGAESVMGEK